MHVLHASSHRDTIDIPMNTEYPNIKWLNHIKHTISLYASRKLIQQWKNKLPYISWRNLELSCGVFKSKHRWSNVATEEKQKWIIIMSLSRRTSAPIICTYAGCHADLPFLQKCCTLSEKSCMTLSDPPFPPAHTQTYIHTYILYIHVHMRIYYSTTILLYRHNNKLKHWYIFMYTENTKGIIL